MEKEALDFPGAVERLATKAGISLRYTDRNEGEGRKKRTRYIETMARAVEWYHQRLLSGPDAGAARSYLRARGLDGDVVREFRLGWAPDGWDELTRALRLDTELAEGTGLARLNRRGRLNDHFRGRILFPIADDRGDPISFGGRILPGRRGPGQPGQVQEHHRDAALQQVQGALRPGPVQDAHRHRRHGRDLRGLHRRDRVPPRRGAARRRHVRHRPHRRPRHHPHPVRRPPAGARLRRRQRRAGRRRAVLPLGARPRPRGRRRRPARRAGPGRRGRATIPTGWRPRSTRRRRSCGSGSTGCSTPPTWPATRAGPGPPSGRSRSWPSTPPSSCGTST